MSHRSELDRNQSPLRGTFQTGFVLNPQGKGAVVKHVKLAIAAVAAAAGIHAPAAFADDFSHWEVRGRAVRVDTAGGSDAISGLVPADVIIVQSKTIPEVDISYFYTKNLSVELVLTYPQKMDAYIAAGGIGHIGSVSVLPPDIMAQWHFTPDSSFDPYVGAGINITWLTKVDLRAPSVSALNLDTNKISVDPALQIGMDYKITRNWVVNADVKKEWMSFDLKANGTKVSTLTVDPWLFSIGVGYKF
jgi:outer membrane protein